MDKKTASIIGIVVGIAIIIIGICVMNPETILLGKRDSLGSLLGQYGADFYTDIYHMTYEVGFMVQKAYVNICNAIGWLIVVFGLFDIAYFLRKAFDSEKPEAPLSNNSTYQQQNSAPARPSDKETIFAAAGNPEPQIKKDNEKIPYRCGKCGQNGPYDENCPSCGSSIKFYNR